MLVVMIVFVAVLLHLAAASMLPVVWAWGASSVVTLLVVVLIRTFSAKGQEVPPATQQTSNAVQVNAVDGVLLRTYEHFSTHFSGANADLAQVQQLMEDAIAKLLESFSGMHQLIEQQRQLGNEVVEGAGNENDGLMTA
ncbi:MAG: hypothetical protein PHF75_09810, partial [Gallionella sp.]|nr:hypothetical protein [Gallionella sp.]